MDDDIKCYRCQNFKLNVGHETKWCPENICKKCGQNGHTKTECMTNFENFPLPNEIVFKIFSYLNLEDQNQCSKVCKRFLEVKNCFKSNMKDDKKCLYNCNMCNKSLNTKFRCIIVDGFEICNVCYSCDGKSYLIMNM